MKISAQFNALRGDSYRNFNAVPIVDESFIQSARPLQFRHENFATLAAEFRSAATREYEKF